MSWRADDKGEPVTQKTDEDWSRSLEAVATDGPIDEARRLLLLEGAAHQGRPIEHCHFLTAFECRHSPAARRRLEDLADDTYAWFLDDPDCESAPSTPWHHSHVPQ
ncbi:BsuBI/PstI family type II restriction endonuclease [Frigoribacterium salinisoli]